MKLAIKLFIVCVSTKAHIMFEVVYSMQTSCHLEYSIHALTIELYDNIEKGMDGQGVPV